MTVEPVTQNVNLYVQDFNLWLKDTVTQLKARDVDHLDWENLIEEIESLGRREKRELESRLETLLEHLLKRIYIDSAYDNGGWENTIAEQRRQLQKILQQSPSLRQHVSDGFEDAWQYALAKTRKAYAKVPFPDRWEFNQEIDVLLTEEFWTN